MQKLYIVVVLLFVISLANCHRRKFDCSYRASDNITLYQPGEDLTGQWFEVNDTSNGQVIYFAVCKIWNVNGPCPYSYESSDEGSAMKSMAEDSHHGRGKRVSVCSYDPSSEKYEVLGLIAERQWADSAIAIQRGFEIIYKSPDSTAKKTVLEFICDSTVEEPIIEVSHPDDLATVITVTSSSACPVTKTYPMIGGSHDYDWREDEHPYHQFVQITIIGLSILSCLLTLCCCCCAARKRKCAKKVASNFSNVAFSPIPSSFQPAQPQFFYYYPPHQTAPHENDTKQYSGNLESVELNPMV